MCDKVLLSMKHLNVTGDRKLVPSFVGPFSIVQWGWTLGLLAEFWEPAIVEHIQSFTSLFLSLFMQVVMGIHIQQLYISNMSKNGKLVGYFSTRDQVEKGSICLPIRDTMNLKLVGYQKVNLAMLWTFLIIAEFLIVCLDTSQPFVNCVSPYLPLLS